MGFFRAFLWVAGCCFATESLLAQPRDTLYLLADKHVEDEAISGLDSMYNFNFEAAKMRFLWLRQEYPAHPLPYFLLGLNEWWKMMPDTKIKTYDQSFISYMNEAAEQAQHIIDKGWHTEGSFLAATSYAFLSRFYGERSAWIKAGWAGKQALNYLEKCRKQKHLGTELLLGDGLYNYYSIWIRENYPRLKLLLMFFGKGDKELGVQQLDYVAKHAFYGRIEAQHFLMRILNEEHKNKEEALQMAAYLHQRYPNNAYFHRYYTRICYEMGDYTKCRQLAEELLRRIEHQRTGYEANSGRYASFFLGWIHQMRLKESEIAKVYYKKVLHFAQKADALERGYSLYSILALGQIAEQENHYKEAKSYYKQAEDLSERGSRIRKQAQKRLRSLRKKT